MKKTAKILIIFAFGVMSFCDYLGAETMLFRIESNGDPIEAIPQRGNKVLGHEEVIRALWSQSATSQSDFIERLDHEINAGNVRSYRQYWIVNIISVTAEIDKLQDLATHYSVIDVYEDLPVSLIDPVEIYQENLITSGVESGLRIIGAADAWAIGLTGEGSLVCNFDTGVNGNHPALTNLYRGNNGGTASACWFDPYTNTQYPIDSHGHGTHTMGIMIGSNGPDTIGVAPRSQWIAAAVVDRGGGLQRTISDILAAFQWAADPDGDPSTFSDVPDVVNNSWGIPLGYYPACSETFWDAIDNLEAAGVVCVFAAGNEGPHSMSLRTPADRIATNFNAFSVGAVDGNSPNLTIASFSSRGPSGCDSLTIKPEVTAPGLHIRSAARNGGYVSMSGTSMATPHVAGAIALLRQFNPQATPDQIKQALMSSADDRGVPGEDNTYGWGIIDVRRALYFMPSPNDFYPVVLNRQISGDGIIVPGEEITINIEIENLGQPLQNASINLSSDDSRVNINGSDVYLETFDRFDTLNAGPWNVALNNDANPGENITFAMRISSGEYQRSLLFSITVCGNGESGIASHNNGHLATSFSNFGQFGLGVSSINPHGGNGFRFPLDSRDFLRLGSLILATDSLHVSDASISCDPFYTDDDFLPSIGGFPFVVNPGVISDQDGYAAYTDLGAENPIGVAVIQKSYCWNDWERASFVIYEFKFKNIGELPISTLRAGIHCDWNLSMDGGNDIVGFDSEHSLGYQIDYQSGLAIGIRGLTSELSTHAAIDNNIVIWNGFSEGEKFTETISGFSHSQNDLPGDYSHIMAFGPFNIASGDSVIIAIAIAAGNSIAELITASEQAYSSYNNVTGIVDEILPVEHQLLSNYPNPFNAGTIIQYTGESDLNANVLIYDMTGRLVRQIILLNNQAFWDGADAMGNAVSTGVYFTRLKENSAATLKMLMIK